MVQISNEDAARTHVGELKAREKMEDNTPDIDDAVTDDPTGGTHDQVAAKIAANRMGDQDEINTGYQYPSGAEVPNAVNVRRYPELFEQEVIDALSQSDDEPVPARDSQGNIAENNLAEDISDGEPTVAGDTGDQNKSDVSLDSEQVDYTPVAESDEELGTSGTTGTSGF